MPNVLLWLFSCIFSFFIYFWKAFLMFPLFIILCCKVLVLRALIWIPWVVRKWIFYKFTLDKTFILWGVRKRSKRKTLLKIVGFCPLTKLFARALWWRSWIWRVRSLLVCGWCWYFSYTVLRLVNLWAKAVIKNFSPLCFLIAPYEHLAIWTSCLCIFETKCFFTLYCCSYCFGIVALIVLRFFKILKRGNPFLCWQKAFFQRFIVKIEHFMIS